MSHKNPVSHKLDIFPEIGTPDAVRTGRTVHSRLICR